MGHESHIAMNSGFLIDLLLILSVAWITGGLFMRFGLPVILGELLAGVTGYNPWQSAVIGFGMSGRGAVALVLSAVVMELSNALLANGTIQEPLLTPHQFSALVLMAFVTTLLAPVCLKWSVSRACDREENEAFCVLWRRSTTMMD